MTRASWSAAQFCSPADYGKIDTVDLYYNNEPDNPNKFGYNPGPSISISPEEEYLPKYRIYMTAIIVNFYNRQR